MHGYERVSGTDPSKGKQFDLESGETLYPGLSYGENELRWAFVRKVYGILAAQLVLTTVVSVIAVLSPPINDLLCGNSGLLLFLCLIPLILVWPLHICHQKHPLNFIILGFLTVFLSLTIGVSCANTDGSYLARKNCARSTDLDSSCARTSTISGQFCSPVLVLTNLIQMFFPLSPATTAVYGAISALIFCGFIVYDTDNLIKRFTYDDYILASATLYLDILNLFLSIVRVLRSGDN
ncbi:LIFEGUARD 5 [Hibiscus trionum]|uniref:LIFEGUARD 5 n=1 Tax=Hibiscus trionum TaxID=183268 RepID=A0A9W7LHB3_HIBTR|nr:LIFEGUARD 5 [Hibiscus trionum]